MPSTISVSDERGLANCPAIRPTLIAGFSSLIWSILWSENLPEKEKNLIEINIERHLPGPTHVNNILLCYPLQ